MAHAKKTRNVRIPVIVKRAQNDQEGNMLGNTL